MKPAIKLLHIDGNYQIRYWIIGEGTKVISKISISQAIQLVLTVPLDLILSEPQGLAILNSPQTREESPDTGFSREDLIKDCPSGSDDLV